MTAPKKPGSGEPTFDRDESLGMRLPDAGAYKLLTYKLLSRSEEVALATRYRHYRAKVRQLTLESLVGSHAFLRRTGVEADSKVQHDLWEEGVSHQQLQRARHQLLLLQDKRRYLCQLRARRSRFGRRLELALAWYTRSSGAVLERLGVTEAFIEEVHAVQAELHAHLLELTPLTQEVELATGLDRDEFIRLSTRAELEPSAFIDFSLMTPAALRRRLLAERQATKEFMLELGLDADAFFEERRAIESARRVRDAARNQMITANLRLVIWVARSFKDRGMAMADVVQEGNLGLLSAIEKFEPERGFRFSTYATWWIRQAMQRGLANRQRTIRLPVHMQEFQRELGKLSHQLTQRLGRQPTPEELARAIGSTTRKLERLKQVEHVRSLDAPVGRGEVSGNMTLADLVRDGAPSPEETLLAGERSQVIDALLQGLSRRERLVVSKRFGMSDPNGGNTLQTIALELGVTRERVRQIELGAIEKLRKRARLMGFAGFEIPKF